MRPLYHPSLDDITVEGILHALSDPVRAHILAKILRANGAQTCSAFLEISEQQVANFRFAAVKKLTEQIHAAGLSGDVFPELRA